MLKKALLVGIVTGVFYSALAEPVVPGGDFAKKLKTQAGEDGKFIHSAEKFPKDYFLVHNNLPFLAGLSLHHPRSSSLKLTKKQIDAIEVIKKQTVLTVVKKSREIKMLELQLANNIAVNSKSVKSQYEIVDAISKLRTELTKAHLQCINDVRAILTKEQYQKLLKYATNLVQPKSNKFRVDELVLLPHPGKLVKTGKIVLSNEQKQRLNQEVKTTIVPKFQEKMREAFELEKKLQRAVDKGKAKEELKDLINQIATLKTQALDVRLDALYGIKKIVTKEQWNKINKLTYQ